MPSALAGLHHVTAIATDPQRNVDFYRTALGLRLVKTTVNFDAPDTYHLYFGNETGQPGTLITFFPWPGAPRGRRGTGQATTVAFSVPQGSMGWWQAHLAGLAVHTGPVTTRSGEEALSVRDPDGLALELVAHPQADSRPPWRDGPIPPEHAIRGLHSVTLTEAGHEHTAALLADTLGFRLVEESSARFRFATSDGGAGALVDVLCSPEAPPGLVAAGTVHHIAWRTPDDAEQVAWRTTLMDQGLNVTPILDRQYFHSIYFREPGGVLLEIATDPPGFTVDEPLMRLGRALKLPPWLEPSRTEIEHALPTLRVPSPDEEITVGGTEKRTGTMTTGVETFIHRFTPPNAPDALTLLLLHGTGGNEDDLLELGHVLDEQAALLSPRGQVSEHGANRWFRRLAEGVFDTDDLLARTDQLSTFVTSAVEHYQLAASRLVAVGFSNGANIAATMLLRHPRLLRAAVLFAPMVTLDDPPMVNLSRVGVFIGAGTADPIAPPEQATRLAEQFIDRGAAVELHWHPDGHGIDRPTLAQATKWLRKIRAATSPGPLP